jgi:hypothetical protein
MHHLHALPLRCLGGALLLLPTFGCVLGEGLLGEYTDTDTGTGTGTGTGTDTGADSGSSGLEPACTENCDPEFAISFFHGGNYAAQSISRLSPSTCVGPSCPASVSPVSPQDGSAIVECLDTEEAQSSPLGPEEHCRITPEGLANRIDFGFTTPVDRSSFEAVRPRLDEPTAEEPYLWLPEVAALHGPGTALRGDYVPDPEGDRLSAVINETCAERLTALGIPWTADQLEALCVGTWNDDGVLRPLKMAPAMVFSSYEGALSTRQGVACDTPQAGPDTCCSPCDRMLGPRVARYGVDGAGERRNANAGTAIACDAGGDVLVECRDLVLDVERDPGHVYAYAWDGAAESWPLPRYDKLRETHPEERPVGLEDGPACSSVSDCDEGQDCIGTNAAGDACHTGADCVVRTCRAEWFGGCQDTTGGSAFCVDRRFSTRGAGACLAATTDFAHGVAGDRLSQCDTNADGQPSAVECCDAALGGAAGCDPFLQPNLTPVARYDRASWLPPEAACVCEEGQPVACDDAVDAWCEAPLGSGSGAHPASPAGDYAVPAVTQLGGVRWYEDHERLGFHPATRGELTRASTEQCAEANGLIGGRSPTDAWLSNVGTVPELLADHDLVLCSGSTYRFVLAESDADHHIRSAGGGTLDGRSEHVIETPQFRITPLPVSAADSNDPFESCKPMYFQLSNAYDPSEINVRKLELHEGAPDGPRVAGGPGCDPLADPAAIAAGAIPCVSIEAIRVGATVGFYIDEAIHGQVLVPGTTYFVVLPGLADIEQMADAEAYAAAFHDACGMPLIVGDTPEQLALWELSFTVDEACS